MSRAPSRTRRRALLALALVALLYTGYRAFIGTPFTVGQLADRQGLYALLHDPEAMTDIGFIDGTLLDWHADQLSSISLAARDADYRREAGFLRELAGFDPQALSPQDQITWQVLDEHRRSALGFQRFPWLSGAGLYPLGPMDGVQVWIPSFLQFSHVVRNARSARHYVARLRAFGPKLDEAIAAMQWQRDRGVVMPLALVERALEVTRDTVAAKPAEHALVTGFARRLADLEDLDEEERSALVGAATEAVTQIVYPAYARAAAALEAVKPAAAARGAGVGDLPDGAAYYAAMLREMTTTDYTPAEVRDLGLAEVARISAEMDRLLVAQGLREGTVGQRMDALARDPRYLLPNTDEGRTRMVARYQQILDEVNARMPAYFRDPPSTRLEVQRVPPEQQAAGPGAYYMSPAVDGSRPGIFFVNLRDLKANPQWGMKTLAYHEGIPGHHFQGMVALRQHDLPWFRRLAWYPAYGEGWALYAERLAAEMGLYAEDPLADLGRLQAELMRAVRLVVDTGLHAEGWSPERAIDYMTSTTGLERNAVISEVERYMESPGQACAYKIGQLKILALREQARSALGPAFDLKDFHAVVLAHGALPLTLLARQVDKYIASQRGKDVAAR